VAGAGRNPRAMQHALQESVSGPPAPPWTVLAMTQGALARVELRRYALPQPNEMWELDDAPILSLVQPRPEGTAGEVMFEGDRRRHRVGRLMLRPGGIAMHSRGNGGVLDILTCRFDPARFAETTGLSDWDGHRLERCAALVSSPIAAMAGRLRREAVEPGFAAAMAVDALADIVMVDLARLLRGTSRATSARGGLALWELRKIEDALRGSEGGWPTTLELAALCGVSRSHLSRAYAATTGTTLSAHAAAIRHERAQEMILKDELTVAQIAYRLGFGSSSAFGAAFRRATGVTPQRYREQATRR